MSVVPGGPRASFSSLGPVSFSQENISAPARAYVKVDGTLYALKSYTINKNCHGATNTATFVVSYNSNPDWTNQLFRGTFGDQSNNSPVYIEIWAGFPSKPGSTPSTSGLVRRFYGVLDEYDPEDMLNTEFHCRAIASPLTTDRVTTQVQNLTTVQFLQQICASYGIKAIVDPELTEPFTLARIYAGEFLVGLHNLVKWDVLLRSSWFDDVDVWEDGGKLYYVHPWNVQSVLQSNPAEQSAIYTPLALTYGTNVKSFKPNHAPQFSRNVRVLVTSYRAKTRVSVATRIQSVVGTDGGGIAVSQVVKTSTATPNFGTSGGSTTTYYNNGNVTYSQWSSSGGPSSGSNAPIADSSLETYHFPIPNLSPTECQRLAIALWRQISQHEYSGEIELAVTPAILPYLNIENRINFSGYGMSLFNTTYWPRSMDESFEMGDENSDTAPGWSVSFKAVNHTPPLGP